MKKRNIINHNQLNLGDLYLPKNLFKILKDLKSRNNISHWFSFDDVFANVTPKEQQEIIELHFINNFDDVTSFSRYPRNLIYSAEKKQIKIITQHFINAILMYSFFRTARKMAVLNSSVERTDYALQACYSIFNLKNLRFLDYLLTITDRNRKFLFQQDRVFWDLYFFMVAKSDLRKNTFIVGADRFNYSFNNIFNEYRQFDYDSDAGRTPLENVYQNILNSFDNVLDLIKYDLVKSKLYRCCFTGLIIRFQQKFNVYDTQHKNDNFLSALIFNTQKYNNNQLTTFNAYIKRVNEFDEPIECPEHFFRLIGDTENGILRFYLVAITDNCAVIDNDPILLSLKLSNLPDNNGNLRDYTNRDYTYLGSALLPYEKNLNNKLFLGYELECFYTRPLRDDTAKRKALVTNIENDYTNNTAICKQDGSLGDYGLEIVSGLMSYDYIVYSNYFQNLYEKIKKDVYSYSSKHSGFHIHLSRDFFTPFEIFILVKFINTKKYRKLFEEIGGRPIHDFDPNVRRYYAFEVDDYSTKHNQLNHAHLFERLETIKSKYETERYVLLNTNNRKTIEFRLFKGNIKPLTIMRYIQFAISLAYYSKTVSYHHANIKTYWNFLEHNKHEYCIIYDFIKKNFETSAFNQDLITSLNNVADEAEETKDETSNTLINLQKKFQRKFKAVRFEIPKKFQAITISPKKARRIYSLTQTRNAI